METSLLFSQIMTVMLLLMIASIAAVVKKHIKLPYSIILVILGAILAILAENVEMFSFLQNFELTPEMVFGIFLPTLIFESAFHLDLFHFQRSIKSISFLATITFAISAFLIGFGVHYIFDIPLIVAFLFGTIISSTDPVTTLALFKEIGAPPRLTTIIEGESLLNDGMSLVTFGIVLELIIGNNEHREGLSTLFSAGGEFIYVVLGGIVVGALLGYIFSFLIANIKNSRQIEITLTLILAHTTFLFAENMLEVSGIIATMIAGMVIGNFGQHKISPSVKEFMINFWDFAAFISNSLIFLLVGKEVITRYQNLEDFSLKTIIIITILGVVVRAISVYVSIPFINMINREKIGGKWAHIIQWGGIRGALALALLLSLPDNIPNKELITFLGLTIVLMSLIINGNSIKWLMGKLNIQAFSIADNFEKHECKVVIDQSIIEKLNSYKRNKFISEDTYQKLYNFYKKDETKESSFISNLISSNQDDSSLYLILKNHFLGIERQTFQKLYARGEITEKLLQILLNNVDSQIENIESKNKTELAPFYSISSENKLLNSIRGKSQLINRFLKKRKQKETMLRYEMYRARIIANNKVLKIIKQLQENDKFKYLDQLNQLQKRYRRWLTKASEKATEIEKKYSEIAQNTEYYIMNNLCLQKEEYQVQTLIRAHILSSKVGQLLLEDIERRKIKNEKCLYSK